MTSKKYQVTSQHKSSTNFLTTYTLKTYLGDPDVEPLVMDTLQLPPLAVEPIHSVVDSNSSYFHIQLVVEGLLEHLSHNVFNGHQQEDGVARKRHRIEKSFTV